MTCYFPNTYPKKIFRKLLYLPKGVNMKETNTPMKNYTNEAGIELNVGDFVTCYFAGYFQITGFYNYKDHMGIDRPQAQVVQLYDSNGNPKKSKEKHCHAEFVELVTTERLERELKKEFDDLAAKKIKLMGMTWKT